MLRPADTKDQLTGLRDSLRQFASERDWDQFHSPKNLAMALVVESGEIVEQFQWMTEEESREISAERRQSVREEVADVFLYLIRLADKLDIDLIESAASKIEANRTKYPIDKARGNSRKYTEL